MSNIYKRKTKKNGSVVESDCWHIRWKDEFGLDRRKSSGTSNFAKAKALLNKIENDIWQKINFDQVKLTRFTMGDLFKKYLTDPHIESKASFIDDVTQIKFLNPYVGDVYADEICSTHPKVEAFISSRKAGGAKNRTVNKGLEVMRHALAIASGNKKDGHEWAHPDDLREPMVARTRRIKKLPLTDAREPYLISWEEQDTLFGLLPNFLNNMCEFAVWSGARDQEICGLEWGWERHEPELNMSYFLIPKGSTKNVNPDKAHDRILILNSHASDIVSRQRGKHDKYVFISEGRKPSGNRLSTMDTTSWRQAKKTSEIPVRIHDLRHAYGYRLRQAGVHEDDRVDLLGHSQGSGRSITRHYSVADLSRLVGESNKIVRREGKVIPIRGGNVGTILAQSKDLLKA